MRTLMTVQQAAFFTQNGYIELAGIPFDPKEIFFAAKTTADIQPHGRDLWRKSEFLQKLLMRKLPPSISQLISKPVRLACDQWMSSHIPEKPCPAQDLFCIQGLILCALFIDSEIPPPIRRPAALGIPPFPRHPENILFVKPHIVLDWPLLKSANLYLAAYSLLNGVVYVHNPKDPATHSLKELGYEFGDSLTEPHHPSLPRSEIYSASSGP